MRTNLDTLLSKQIKEIKTGSEEDDMLDTLLLAAILEDHDRECRELFRRDAGGENYQSSQ